jgi:hypothetical protein
MDAPRILTYHSAGWGPGFNGPKVARPTIRSKLFAAMAYSNVTAISCPSQRPPARASAKAHSLGGKPTYEQLQKTLRKLAGGQTRKSRPKEPAGRKLTLQNKALSELAQMFASPELVADDPTPLSSAEAPRSFASSQSRSFGHTFVAQT